VKSSPQTLLLQAQELPASLLPPPAPVNQQAGADAATIGNCLCLPPSRLGLAALYKKETATGSFMMPAAAIPIACPASPSLAGAGVP